MKRRICSILILLTFVAILCGCKRGKVNGAELVIGDSTLYSKEEIEDAMKIVKDYFKDNFKGCTLTELSYDESRSMSHAETWRDAYGSDDIIVLFSNFDVDASGGDGSLDPNGTYENWSWILTRKEKGDWKLRNNGY